VLSSYDLSLGEVRARVAETIGPIESDPTGSPPFTPRAKKVLELSFREALKLGDRTIGTEHVLLGLIREGEGVAVTVLTDLGVDLGQARARVVERLGVPEGEAAVVAERVFPIGVMSRGGEAVGTFATLRVVVAGRLPEHYGEAHARLSRLLSDLGLDAEVVLPSQLEVRTVQTSEGPGMVVSATVALPGDAAPGSQAAVDG
jgi:hypothetical protein